MVLRVDMQELAFTVYSNIENRLATLDPSDNAHQMLTEMRDGFLRIDEFSDALLISATEHDINTTPIVDAIAAAEATTPGFHSGFANNIFRSFQNGEVEYAPADITEGYAPRAEVSIANLQELQELQAQDSDISRTDFEQELTNLNPRFAEFFENVADSDGWISDDPIVGQLEAALNGDPAVLNQLIEISGDDASMDALVTASATDAGRASLSHVLEAATPAIPEAPAAPSATDSFVLAAANSNTIPETSPAIDREEVVMSQSVILENAAPTSDFVWDDDAIMSTYDALKGANPETISGASDVTQEAFAVVQQVTEIETNLAQYNLAPYAYEGLPPTIAALEEAENAAYDYLSGLSPSDAQTIGYEASAIVSFDTENGFTPLTPSQQGGQDYLAAAGINETGTATLAQEAEQAAAAAQAELDAEDVAMAVPVLPAEAPIDINTLSREELGELLSSANENGGATYETYRESFIALNPDYENFFVGLETQGGQVQELLVGALNNPESQTLETMVSYADDPAALEALTVMVTDDASPETFIADERQMSEFISSLARENGLDVLTAPDGNSNFTVLEDGQVVADGVQELGPTVQTQLDIMIDSPEVIVSEGTELSDNIPESHITRITPEGIIVPPTPDERFDAPADAPSVPSITEPFLSAALEPVQEASVDSTYIVEGGDNLWDIAAEQYELTDSVDIMRAVNHIARANGLENGVDANHIDIGQELQMPSAGQISQDVESLNWTALDKDPTIGGGSAAYLADRSIAAAPQIN